jgi:hypothetical protein
VKPDENRQVVSHPQARDAALRTFDYWSKISTREEAFDHAIAEYLIARQISAKATTLTIQDQTQR